MFCTRCGIENPDEVQFCRQCGDSFAQVRYAGFWLRFWAYLLDLMILGLLPVLISMIIAPLFFTGAAALAILGIWIFIVPVLLAEGWLYYALMESGPGQATVGKRVLGLKVTSMSGERITFGAATIRYFAKILSGLMLHIGFIMAAFTQKKQALHDIIASCLVIRT